MMQTRSNEVNEWWQKVPNLKEKTTKSGDNENNYVVEEGPEIRFIIETNPQSSSLLQNCTRENK